MSYFTPFNGWMAFERLDYSPELDHAFTLAFKMTDDWNEPWTSRFNRFKAGDDKALYGAGAVFKAAMPELLKAMGGKPSDIAIVPALGSADKAAGPDRHITRLAAAIGKEFGLTFDRTSVTKDPHPSLHELPPSDRIPTLMKANYAAKPINSKTVLILDDFITQGATLSFTATALKKANPKLAVFGVALGKTERRAYWEGRGAPISNDHVPGNWDDHWVKGEQRYLDNQKKGA